jgi:NTP pyrophosphatase (non-canonical NTP hydrolase)
MDIKEVLKEIELLTHVDKKNLLEMSLKTTEEVGELAEAVLSSSGVHGNNYKGKTKQDVLEEAADTVICAISVAIKAGFGLDDITRMAARKCEKWAATLKKE